MTTPEPAPCGWLSARRRSAGTLPAAHRVRGDASRPPRCPRQGPRPNRANQINGRRDMSAEMTDPDLRMPNRAARREPTRPAQRGPPRPTASQQRHPPPERLRPRRQGALRQRARRNARRQARPVVTALDTTARAAALATSVLGVHGRPPPGGRAARRTPRRRPGRGGHPGRHVRGGRHGGVPIGGVDRRGIAGREALMSATRPLTAGTLIVDPVDVGLLAFLIRESRAIAVGRHRNCPRTPQPSSPQPRPQLPPHVPMSEPALARYPEDRHGGCRQWRPRRCSV